MKDYAHPSCTKIARFEEALDYTMSSADVDSDLIPADEWYDPYLRFALYLGGAFQLICILAVLFLPSEGATRNPVNNDGDDFDSEVSLLSSRADLVFVVCTS